MADVAHFPADLVREQIEAVLGAWGMPEDKRRQTAELMVETDLMGIDLHGVSMLILYEKMHQAGQLRLAAEPRIVRETAATALIDGGAGLGHPVATMAMELAIAKAEAHDIGAVSVFNSHHFGACGLYGLMAARRNLFALVSTTSRIVTVVPTFGGERVLGTNPLCFVAPAGRNPPIMLDMSTSVTAANKVKTYALNGKPIPDGWVVDGAGAPLTDSMAAYDLLFEGRGGGLAPVGGRGKDLGGHKGYGLGIVAQILSGTLSGGSFSPIRNLTQKPSDPDNIGHFFLAMNPAAFRPLEDFKADMDVLADRLRQTRPADSDEPVLVPGDPEWAMREKREKTGIPIPESLADKLREIAAAAGAPFVLGKDKAKNSSAG